MYTKITNPKTGKRISIQSRSGKNIIRNYLTFLRGGAAADVCAGYGTSAIFKRELFDQPAFSSGPFIQFPKTFFTTTAAAAAPAPTPSAVAEGGAVVEGGAAAAGDISFLMHKIEDKDAFVGAGGGEGEHGSIIKALFLRVIGSRCKVKWVCTSCKEPIPTGVTAYTWWDRDPDAAPAALVESHCQTCVDKRVLEHANEYLWGGLASDEHKGLIILSMGNEREQHNICRVEGLSDKIPEACGESGIPDSIKEGISPTDWRKLCEFLSLPEVEQTFATFTSMCSEVSIAMNNDNFNTVLDEIGKVDYAEVQTRNKHLFTEVSTYFTSRGISIPQPDKIHKLIEYMKNPLFFQYYFPHLFTTLNLTAAEVVTRAAEFHSETGYTISLLHGGDQQVGSPVTKAVWEAIVEENNQFKGREQLKPLLEPLVLGYITPKQFMELGKGSGTSVGFNLVKKAFQEYHKLGSREHPLTIKDLALRCSEKFDLDPVDTDHVDTMVGGESVVAGGESVVAGGASAGGESVVAVDAPKIINQYKCKQITPSQVQNLASLLWEEEEIPLNVILQRFNAMSAEPTPTSTDVDAFTPGDIKSAMGGMLADLTMIMKPSSVDVLAQFAEAGELASIAPRRLLKILIDHRRGSLTEEDNSMQKYYEEVQSARERQS